MFTSLLLTTAVASGQPPAGYYPPGVLPQRPAQAAPRGAYQVIQQTPPGTLPPAATGAQPTPMPMTTPMPKAGAPMPPAANGNGNGAAPAEEPAAEEPEEEPTKYFFERTIEGTRFGEILSNRGITIYGWTQFGYNASTASGSNAPVFMNDRANEFQLYQNYLVMEKTLDTEKDEFQWGWRTDFILPGTDYRTTLPRGLWNNQLRSNNGGPELYGVDIFQFYAQAYLPGIGNGTTVKVGRFATHCGYELVQAADTPFVTRSYVFQYNPFTHTGVWATTALGDNWTVGYGLATGSDTFIQESTNRLNFLGNLKWAPKDGDTSVSFNAVITNPTYIAAQTFFQYNYYGMIVTQKLGENLSYVLDASYSHMSDFVNANGDRYNVDWYGAAQYLMYNHCDNLTSTFRVELFEDGQGARTGFAGLYTAATYGIAWKPTPGLVVRPYARYDNNNRTQVWEGSQNLFTGGLDVIVRW